jgi:hypothetical protein
MNEKSIEVTLLEKYESEMRENALLRKAVRFMSHTDDCDGYYEWSDTTDHFRTTLGAPIVSDKCGCGMIQLALQIEREISGNAAIPRQHREELGSAVPQA